MRPRAERLSALLASVETMAGGDHDHRAEVSAEHDELDALSFAINVLVGELSYAAATLARAKAEAELRSAELAAAHESLVRQERLATLGQLAGGVAHQIRNPLAAILNATYVMKRHLPSGEHPDVHTAVDIIHEEIRHANAVITGLLDYARVKQPMCRPTSISGLVERALASSEPPDSVRVERAFANDLPSLHIDPDQVRVAVVNLIHNALEAMPDGGTLGIQVCCRGETVVVVVTDTGPGIAPEVRAHVFEPLHSTKPLGVGLGLVTARALVEAHGGRVDSVPVAEGARFEIALPFDAAIRGSATQRSR